MIARHVLIMYFALGHLAIGDRNFIAAAGRDQGITLYQVLDSGKLVEIATFISGVDVLFPQFSDL